MVNSQIETAGVSDAAILASFSAVPREAFVPDGLKDIAYLDDETRTAQGRFLMTPHVHAKLLQGAKLQPHEVVLDVGCGNGYSAAVLSPLVMTVIALERDKGMLQKAAKHWKNLNLCNIVPLEGCLAAGAPEHGAFDLIIINGGVAEIPQTLVEQLSPTGRLVTVLRPQGKLPGKAVIVRRSSGDKFSVVDLFDAATGYLPEFAPTDAFSF